MLPALLLAAVVASGQPGGSPAAAPVASAGATVGREAGAPAPSALPGDLGDAPPKTAEADRGPSASPLNPRADEFPDGAVPPPPADYDELLGDIAALRARVAALTTTLFASKLRVIVETDDGDSARIERLKLTLDDGVVYRAPKRFQAEDGKTIYEHAVAPGHHVVGVEVERSDVRNKSYTTWQATRVSVVVPEAKIVETRVLIEDDSDMAGDFPEDRDGTYELNVQIRARVIED